MYPHDRYIRLMLAYAATRARGLFPILLLLTLLVTACSGSHEAPLSPAAQAGEPVSARPATTPAAMVTQVGEPTSLSMTAMPDPERTSAADASIPDTAAGRKLEAWLQAFNSGDPAQLRRFLEENASTQTGSPSVEERVLRQTMSYRQSQGYRLYRVESASDTEITLVAQAKLPETWLRLKLLLEADPPHRIQGFMIMPIDQPPEVAQREKLSESQIARLLEAYLAKLAQADRFSGTVLVAKDGAPILVQAYGMANKETRTPNRADTSYKLASVSKMFAAIAIGQLAEQGKLSFDDPIATYLPGYPAEVARKVTIHHLLTHSSGIADFFFVDPERIKAVRDSRNPHRDYIQVFADKPLAFEPGTRFQYSNSNFLLLGAIVERISGESYYEYVRKHIFEPAGMHKTVWDGQKVEAGRRALAYTEFGPDGVPTPGELHVVGEYMPGVPVPQPAIGGAFGGGYSTVSDLQKFLQALHKHTLLSEKYTEQMFTERIDGGEPGYRYGYGFWVYLAYGQHAVGQSGAAPGTNTKAFMFPTGYDVIILANYDSAAQMVMSRLAEWLMRS